MVECGRSTGRAYRPRLRVGLGGGSAPAVVDGLLRERRLSYEGEHWSVRDATLVPAPVQEPRPPLIVAGNGSRGLRLAAERGDASVRLGDT